MSDFHDYHYARAVAELDAAQRSLCPEAVQAHCGLAELHLERAKAERPPNVFELSGSPRDPAARLREVLVETESGLRSRWMAARD